MPRQAFLSYDRNSKTEVRALAADLEVLDQSVWFDRFPSGGRSWWEEILNQIRRCEVFVLTTTPESLGSGVCQLELKYACDLEKPVLLVLTAPDLYAKQLPHELSKMSHVDYQKNDRRAGLELARAFNALPVSKPRPDPLPAAPDLPVVRLANFAEQIDQETSLTYEQQCVLLIKLRRSLREQTTADEAVILLEKLKARRDLAEEVVEETDEILKERRSGVSSRNEGRRRTLTPTIEKPKAASRARTQPTAKTLLKETDTRKSETEQRQPVPFGADRRLEDVFVDPNTELMWTLKDNGWHVDWSGANDYAKKLSTNGYTDWRLPSLAELEQLYDAKNTGVLKVKRPIELSHRFIWSCSVAAGASRWVFDFGYGRRKSAYADDSHMRVLCVRKHVKET